MRVPASHWFAALLVSTVAHATVLTRLAAIDEGVMVEAGLGVESPVWGVPVAAFAEEVAPSRSASPATGLPIGPATEMDIQDSEPVTTNVDAKTAVTGPDASEAPAAAATATAPVIPAEATIVEPIPTEAVPAPAVPGLAVEEVAPEVREITGPTEVVEARAPDVVESEVMGTITEVAAIGPTAPSETAPSESEPGELAGLEPADAVTPEQPEPVAVASVSAEQLPPVPLPVARERPKPDATDQVSRARKTAPPSRQASAASAPSGQKAGGQGRVSDATGRDIRSNYSGRVMAHLERSKRYPRAAQSRRISGSVRVRFTLADNGAVRGSSIVGSSGHEILDTEVRAMLRRASPFPAIPDELDRRNMTFTVTVRFVPR